MSWVSCIYSTCNEGTSKEPLFKKHKHREHGAQGVKTWQCLVVFNYLVYQRLQNIAAQNTAPLIQSSGAFVCWPLKMIIYLPFSPLQVQKWDEQQDSGSFPGKIWTLSFLSIHWTFLILVFNVKNLLFLYKGIWINYIILWSFLSLLFILWKTKGTFGCIDLNKQNATNQVYFWAPGSSKGQLHEYRWSC